MLKKMLLVSVLACVSVSGYAKEFIGLEGRFGLIGPTDTAVIDEKKTWTAGTVPHFEHKFALPSKDYSLSIETDSNEPITVSMKGKTPMLELNQNQKGKVNGVNFGVRTDRRENVSEEGTLIVRVGKDGHALEGGEYRLTMRPYVSLLRYVGPLSAGEDEPMNSDFIGLE